MVFPVARYTLIMKDETYVKLVNQAKIEGISVGKLINKILNEWAEGAGKAGGLPKPCVCIVCGRPATIKAIGKAQQTFYVCPLHKRLAEKMDGWKQLQTNPR